MGTCFPDDSYFTPFAAAIKTKRDRRLKFAPQPSPILAAAKNRAAWVLPRLSSRRAASVKKRSRRRTARLLLRAGFTLS